MSRDIDPALVEKATQAAAHVLGDPKTCTPRKIARAVLAAVLPDVRRAVAEEFLPHAADVLRLTYEIEDDDLASKLRRIAGRMKEAIDTAREHASPDRTGDAGGTDG